MTTSPTLNQTSTTMTVAAVETVAVAVADQDRALSFYTDTLGLELRMDASYGPGQRWVTVAPRGARTSIALVRAQDGQRTGPQAAIRLATPDAAAAHTHLLALGFDVDPDVLRWPGVPAMFSLRDPDGNALVLVENTDCGDSAEQA